MDEERFVFDAFVSYAHQDMKWVVRELLPKLEYEAKIRLCLHQRYDSNVFKLKRPQFKERNMLVDPGTFNVTHIHFTIDTHTRKGKSVGKLY